MKHVRIAELKAHLSKYLREAQRGHTIAVLDRDTPIAHIVPIAPIPRRPKLIIQEPAPGTPPPNRFPIPKPANLDFDIVDLLLETRQNHR
jgi:prevent-host-death family protein